MSSIPIKFIRYGLLLKIPHSLDKICERSKENVEIKKVKTAIVHVDEGKVYCLYRLSWMVKDGMATGGLQLLLKL
ncbi:hypothetical protein Tco_0441943 [Tanacetum coccineum]